MHTVSQNSHLDMFYCYSLTATHTITGVEKLTPPIIYVGL